MFVNILKEYRNIDILGRHCTIWLQEITRSQRGDVYNGRLCVLTEGISKVFMKAFNLTNKDKRSLTQEEIMLRYMDSLVELTKELPWVKNLRHDLEIPASDHFLRILEPDSLSKKLLPSEESLTSSDVSTVNTSNSKSKRVRKK